MNIIVSEKEWNKSLPMSLEKEIGGQWLLIDKREDFNLAFLKQFDPKRIFIPHWSYIIPKEIYTEYECIVFHMTDLPHGRGGSPLQNLIINGYKDTMISAIAVSKEIDAGGIYLKRPLSLHGTAEEILIRASEIIDLMIIAIMVQNLKPTPQKGSPTIFKRRKPGQSNIAKLKSMDKLYDHIRMLDAEGYPKAFIENEHFRFEFSRASFKSGKIIISDVEITEKK